MKSGSRLDSAVFQLTPTRTRCDLVIIANGKTEKIASGLLSPFLAHLKTAQDQVAKGGYSITLKPDPGGDAVWFSKGTMERFVRFVSTPEVLERVSTIESEILQIEEAISMQSNENLGLSSLDASHKKVEDHQRKSLEGLEGSKPEADIDSEKAIVLYKPGAGPPESNGSATQEENSKVQLLRVLETRRSALRKEQGMAFARAAAAGFEMDPMVHLISFAECFGASRLMEACIRFMNLWKEKHESGQWLEIEAAEVMSARSDFSSMNASGNMPFFEPKKAELQEAWSESNGGMHGESNGKTGNDANSDRSPPLPSDQREYFQGQFPHPMFPQWPPGAPPVFQPYPMQGMPYYPNYPGGGPYFQPSYPPMDNPRFSAAQRTGLRRHSLDSKDNTELESWELGVPNERSHDGSELEKESSEHRDQRKKACGSGKNKSGVVVIRNINYITSKKEDTSSTDSESDSDPGTDEEMEDLPDAASKKHKDSIKSSKSQGSHLKSNSTRNPHENDGMGPEQEAQFGNWQAFQNCLLRDGNDDQNTGKTLFSMEKEDTVVRRRNPIGPDPILPHGREVGEVQGGRTRELYNESGRGSRIRNASRDIMVKSGEEFGRGYRDGKVDVLTSEIEGGGRGYRRRTNDDFMIYGQNNKFALSSSHSDPLSGEAIQCASDSMHSSSSKNVTDESYIVPLRSISQDQIGTGTRTALDMDVEFPSGLQKTDDSSTRMKSQLNYEPDDLSLLPERRAERESVGYDPAIDYEDQERAENVGMPGHGNKGGITNNKEVLKKVNKDKKSKDSFEKRKIEAGARKAVKPSKLGPSNEAQARAERLRAFKADLQKMKKEKEEEELKRLEALKRERQKRIAARGSAGAAQSSGATRSKPQFPAKLSPSSQKRSKFSDSEPGSSSPLQRFPIRTVSVESSDTQKFTKPTRLSSGSYLAGNGLSRSVSSLPELKKEKVNVTPESKISSGRLRRLSEPKASTTFQISSVKAQKTVSVSKPKSSDGPEMTKISAIMRLDKTKAATLPELKIKTPTGASNIVNDRSVAKDSTQKTIVTMPSVTSENTKSKNDEKKRSNGDESLIIDKTVVMLESQTPQIPVIQELEERMEIRCSSDKHKVGEKADLISENVTLPTSASSPNVLDVVQDLVSCKLEDGPNSNEVASNRARKEPAKLSGTEIDEKPPYLAPYARTTSLEDSCTVNSEYSRAPPTNSVAATGVETSKAYVSEFSDLRSLEPIPESIEKSRGKESSKGFKRLLKFGRKNSSSSTSEHGVESDKVSINYSQDSNHGTSSSASFEVHTLKNLISQDETPTSGTPQKVSRPFSLLSPFRSKTSEKKMTHYDATDAGKNLYIV